MDSNEFNASDRWLGSYYELAIELGISGDNDRLLAAANCLWSLPMLNGPWVARSQFGQPPSNLKVQENTIAPCYGVLILGDNLAAGCVVHTLWEYEGSDWLALCIPTGWLETLFDVSYPLLKQTNPWVRQVDDLFVEIGSAIFDTVVYRMAVIGEEVSSIYSADSIKPHDLQNTPFLLTQQHAKSLGALGHATKCAEGLYYVGNHYTKE